VTTATAPAPMFPLDTTEITGNFITVHTIATYTGVNMNRDFDGLPKQIVFGGVPRLRVSAQSKARAIRVWHRNNSTDSSHNAVSTRLLPQQTSRALVNQHGIDPADALPAAVVTVLAAGIGIDLAKPGQTKAITPVPADAADRLAKLAKEHWEELKGARDLAETAITAALKAAADKEGGKRGAKKAPAADADKAPAFGAAQLGLPVAYVAEARAAFAPGTTTEMALFGRMLTELPEGEVYSSVQVAHAIGVDPYEEITDRYTVMDDWQDLGVFGAANTGEKYLASGTLYSYTSLDRRALRTTLAKSGVGDDRTEELAKDAERLFVNGCVLAVPSGNRSRTGSAVLPTVAVACATDLPLTAAAAFETVVDGPAGLEAAYRLGSYLRRTSRFSPLHGGKALWMPPVDADAPEFPASITVEV